MALSFACDLFGRLCAPLLLARDVPVIDLRLD